MRKKEVKIFLKSFCLNLWKSEMKINKLQKKAFVLIIEKNDLTKKIQTFIILFFLV